MILVIIYSKLLILDVRQKDTKSYRSPRAAQTGNGCYAAVPPPPPPGDGNNARDARAARRAAAQEQAEQQQGGYWGDWT